MTPETDSGHDNSSGEEGEPKCPVHVRKYPSHYRNYRLQDSVEGKGWKMKTRLLETLDKE